MLNIFEIASELNERATSFPFGRLQEIRKKIKGLSRSNSVIFDKRSTFDAGYAFHYGGRPELQFNIGYDSESYNQLRYGIAFSFQEAREISYDDFKPKVDRLNDFIELNPAIFDECTLRLFKNDTAPIIRNPTERLTYEDIETYSFVIFGKVTSRNSPDYDAILIFFSDLLPLYEAVESKTNKNWTRKELKGCLEAYMHMVELEMLGESFNKAEINRSLREGPLSDRSRGSIEFRMQNLTSYFKSKNLPYVEGYKPRGNIGPSVIKTLDELRVEISIETEADQINEAVSPLKSNNSRYGHGQGYIKNQEHKKLIELRAMKLATQHMEQLGFTCKDISSNQPYDLFCSKEGYALKVEVKGTSTADSNTIFMSKNEVELHQTEKGKTALIIVSHISIASERNEKKAIGGVVKYMEGWDIDKSVLIPTTYRVNIPTT